MKHNDRVKFNLGEAAVESVRSQWERPSLQRLAARGAEAKPSQSGDAQNTNS